MSVFHLKYRPQKLAELDSAEVAARLSRVLGGGETGQSFLFSGPKGAGKTSAARIVAKAVNCLKPVGVEPCDKCGNCQEITSGRSLDIIEIDAASNRGIDDVRSLKDKAYLLPSKLKKKVFIVDEAHMLTKEAFNALLKLLEEPPSHTMFLLCTTDPDRMPETILSRVVRIDFRRGNEKELIASLKRIIEGEKIEIREAAIKMVASKSDGSFRNLQKMFNEIILEFGKKVGLAQVEEYFSKKVGDYGGEELEADLETGRVGGIVDRLEKMAKAGVDLKRCREEMMVFFHRRLVGSLVGGFESRLNVVQLERWLELLGEAGKVEKETEISQLPLELAVVKFLNDKEQKINEIRYTTKEKPARVVDKRESGEGGDKLDQEELQRRWPEVLAVVKPYNHSVEAFLRATRPKKLLKGRLTLEVYYQFHKDRLEEAKNREMVEDGLKQVFGREIKLECELSEGKKPAIRQVSSGGGKGDIYEVAKEIFG